MKNILKKYWIYISVFLSGATVLIMEVVAFRILSPFFGNTIFTTSSVIGVVLGALSLGYYVGGRLADKYPSYSWFFGIISVGGVSVVGIELLGDIALPILGGLFSISIGPLISSLLLFSLPSFILGMLSPFAIKIQKDNNLKEGVGSVSGKVFFWSTTGSIFGSLFAGFVLIPQFGVDVIMLVSGTTLALFGVLSLGVPFTKKWIPPLLILLVVMLGASILVEINPEGLVYEEDGIYQRIRVIKNDYNGEPALILRLGKSWSGGMFVESGEPAFNYLKFRSLYNAFNKDLDKALVLGGGAYVLPRELLEEYPMSQIHVSEIEPELLNIGKRFFGLSDSDRLKVFTQDGRRFLKQVDSREYDLIFGDAFSSLYSVPAHMTTREFLSLAKSKLSDSGVFIGNIIGTLSSDTNSFVKSEIKTFKSVFPNSYFFAVIQPHYGGLQNIIMLGSKKNSSVSLASMQEVMEDKGINLKNHLINVNSLNLRDHPILVDDYAPVDYFLASDLKFSNL